MQFVFALLHRVSCFTFPRGILLTPRNMIPIFLIQHWGTGVAVHKLWVKSPPSQFVTAIMRLLDANVIDSYYLPGWQNRKISGVCWRCAGRQISCLFFYFFHFLRTMTVHYHCYMVAHVPRGRITGSNDSKIKFTSQFIDVSISQE